jgi:hypothetical protein
MAEFEQLRDQLRQARNNVESAADAVIRAQERLKQISAQESALDRVFNARDQQHIAERHRLQEEKARAQAELTRQRDARGTALAGEADILKDFVRFTDPREGIVKLDDATPILLMPVRLETRFKTINAPGAPAPLRQLWVRIYPDDCWIDSFDPALTETEVANAKTYWSAIWQAGGIEDQERGAWRGLAASHGSGRASWIIRQFTPVNFSARPTKPRAEDVILTIPTETPLPPSEEAATLVFWRALWLADGDAQKTAAAKKAFENVVGAVRATEIAREYQPLNFNKPLAPGVAKNQVNVSAAFVVFPTVATKQSAWSRAPRFTILPDRFVFIGYEGAEATKIEIGQPVPSPLSAGPDPSAPQEEQLKHDADGNLIMPDELKWIADFDVAVKVGMGFRIDLNEAQARRGFDRVLVVGLRLSADAKAAKGELETLFQHHAFSRAGLAILPQGTPTNNTEAEGSGFKRLDDPDESFDDQKAPLFVPEVDWLEKRDGQWIAEYLGVDPALFARVHQAGAGDQLAARALNIALWPATLGYWMETMMAPVFSRDAIEQTRGFFNRYVIGAGAVPAIRIGAQPYGILPATALSRMRWLSQRFGDNIAVAPLGGGGEATLAYLRQLYPILLAIDQDWRAKLADVSFVGKAGDPHALLLDIIGLHSGSVEWSQRYAENLATLYNRLNLLGFGGVIQAILIAAERAAARGLLTRLGYGGAKDPFILGKIFSGKHNLLKGGVVDDRPLSETEPIRAYTAAGQNYIQWLIDAAAASLDALYRQEGFIDDKPPAALLYLLLRHALQLGYHDVSVRLHESAGLYTAEMALKARSDDPFLHVRDNPLLSESRYQPLYATQVEITGSPTQTVSQFIAAQLPTLGLAFYLREQKAALERLKFQPTARLERSFADHIDCCAYRLDAWLLGLVHYQLALMRNLRDREDAPARPGIYLGGYAWLEEVRPENKALTPVVLRDPALVKTFGDEPPLMRDSANEGYIHAPSLNHAVAAAVLRTGYISNASPENRQSMAVNLTSERVRTALSFLEGIRAGQGLADLLGYQFERGLHDRHNLAEVDKFIFKLRKAFPLRADRLNSTKTEEGVPIEAIEARNVIDGLALVEHMKATNQKAYPFGKPDLPAASAAEAAAINAEADRLLESHDAVADLALSEGVYQAVLGNYERVASTYDAYARGNFPPEPDVIRTPFNGIGVTHRVALHLEAGADPNLSPIPGLAMTPRAQAEPAINRWLEKILPPLDQVGCVVSFRDAVTGTSAAQEITLLDLELQPADLMLLIRDDNQQAMTELDDRIVRYALTHFTLRPDVPVAIRYLEKQAAPFSVFELMPLIRNVRRLVTQSRPLKASDLALMNEATSAQDSEPFVDKARLVAARNVMENLRNDLAAFQTQLEGPLADLENRRAEILANVDDTIGDVTALLARAAAFAVAQAGWGFAYDFKRRTFAAILEQCAELVNRWNARLDEFEARLLEEQALPASATDQERFDLLLEAERAISTTATLPLPPTPALFRTGLENIKRPAFENKRGDFAGVQNTTRTAVSLLLADVRALLPVSDFDAAEFSLGAREDEIIRFAEDALSVVKVVAGEIDRRLGNSQTFFDEYDTAAAATDKVGALEAAAKALLGADFRIFPEFSLSGAQGDEIQNALNASRSGELFQFLAHPPDPNASPLDFPVDTWLYGVARVREKMHEWEQTVMFAGAFRRPEPELEAMQLPFIPNDRWLALDFPPGQKLDTDRLLYTAHFSTPFNKAARQCGLLLDEWTETIPTESVDTGITFHYDRPNCEAPQTMLLVTPSEFRGGWQWQDLVDALNETLDFAKRRAIEPKHIDQTPYAPFLPATIMATQMRELTIAADLALNNKVALALS